MIAHGSKEVTTMFLLKAITLVSLLNANCDVAAIEIAKRPLIVMVANASDERSRGLMRRRVLSPFDGMIFAYDSPRHVRLWMQDTPLPLDMLFFDGNGRLVSLHRNAVPLDQAPIDGGSNVQYVVELQAGGHPDILAEPNILELNACNGILVDEQLRNKTRRPIP
ncbi:MULTISPECIES: DUF192 domain-containing protein [Rhizobium]|uniref:DUF192 domain-containing protein n=2 Tax=Rhizobium TaxID=379 RepID=A0A6N9ZRW3_9HYPH|nr:MULTISPECIES: DUF192 domain-containing protein [Rhizobium]MBB4444197.1 hypothetical protein [Rhizobium esperanzae]MDH6206791.1 uncharacterized membrane protein (UPF0127 family) [Rhizobium leguminosarum]NEH96082.1 DUF192 domain-containing protein [Rhizobium laguerreae]NEK39734.1 DUF192 domain-containing protein [Rhizobium leguminosarum]NEK46997.1 DUF192 domain-containing protein [Rhizobium leguminosarum]